MSLGISFLDTGMGYIQQGLEFIRNLLMKVVALSPLNPELSVTIIFFLASLWLGQFIARKFVTQPFGMGYILWTLIITISIFLNLMYL